jgi:hypothetical protein
MSEYTVDEAMQRFKEYDWLANCDQDSDGNWKMLFAPNADPSEEILDEFWDDMDHLMEAKNLDNVMEIGNGWFVFKEDTNE